jgi:uncharacterized protein (TIGR01777 family)
VLVLVRSLDRAEEYLPTAERVVWQATSSVQNVKDLEGLDAVVHLAGESIAAARWSEKQKKNIRDSRVLGTRHLVEALNRCERRPAALISASAIGYYGDRGDEPLDESSEPGTGFLADICQQWDREALRARDLGIRVVLLRTGLVLSNQGGALPRMLLPFKMFVGGPLGSGRQWISWIHIDDEVEVIRYALAEKQIEGALNATAPHPLMNREFSRELGKVLNRPSLMPVPGFALRFALGEMGERLLLEGQCVLPRKLEAAGYNFRFPGLSEALKYLLG